MPLEDLEGPDKFIDAFNNLWPLGSDPKAEGDNHIRGIKNVLDNTLVDGADNIIDAVLYAHYLALVGDAVKAGNLTLEDALIVVGNVTVGGDLSLEQDAVKLNMKDLGSIIGSSQNNLINMRDQDDNFTARIGFANSGSFAIRTFNANRVEEIVNQNSIAGVEWFTGDSGASSVTRMRLRSDGLRVDVPIIANAGIVGVPTMQTTTTFSLTDGGSVNTSWPVNFQDKDSYSSTLMAICLVGDLGYGVGDTIVVAGASESTRTGSGLRQGAGIVVARASDNGISILDAVGGVPLEMNLASWEFYVLGIGFLQ